MKVESIRQTHTQKLFVYFLNKHIVEAYVRNFISTEDNRSDGKQHSQKLNNFVSEYKNLILEIVSLQKNLSYKNETKKNLSYNTYLIKITISYY